MISVYVLPVLLILLLVYCVIRRVKVYDCFLLGAKEGLSLAGRVFPYIAAIFICIEAFKASGIAFAVAEFLKKPLSFLGVPSEIAELILLVPLSGNGTIALLEDIIAECGVDSYPARCAAVIAGASETVFYIAAVYFSKCKSKKLSYAIPVSLVCTSLGALAACALVKLM